MADSPISEPCADGGYLWILTPEEREHIASLLNCDIDKVSINANHMVQDRQACTNCGKISGLDDLVQNALSRGVHPTSFILDVLENGPRDDSPEHDLACSTCGVIFKAAIRWYPGRFGWAH
ncbi:RBP protein [Aspergillus crustosus]